MGESEPLLLLPFSVPGCDLPLFVDCFAGGCIGGQRHETVLLAAAE